MLQIDPPGGKIHQKRGGFLLFLFPLPQRPRFRVVQCFQLCRKVSPTGLRLQISLRHKLVIGKLRGASADPQVLRQLSGGGKPRSGLNPFPPDLLSDILINLFYKGPVSLNGIVSSCMSLTGRLNFYLASILKELFKDTIRLNTRLPGLESLLSTQKYPFLTN